MCVCECVWGANGSLVYDWKKTLITYTSAHSHSIVHMSDWVHIWVCTSQYITSINHFSIGAPH